jgi:hypothetical protein
MLPARCTGRTHAWPNRERIRGCRVCAHGVHISQQAREPFARMCRQARVGRRWPLASTASTASRAGLIWRRAGET